MVSDVSWNKFQSSLSFFLSHSFFFSLACRDTQGGGWRLLKLPNLKKQKILFRHPPLLQLTRCGSARVTFCHCCSGACFVVCHRCNAMSIIACHHCNDASVAAHHHCSGAQPLSIRCLSNFCPTIVDFHPTSIGLSFCRSNVMSSYCPTILTFVWFSSDLCLAFDWRLINLRLTFV